MPSVLNDRLHDPGVVTITCTTAAFVPLKQAQSCEVAVLSYLLKVELARTAGIFFIFLLSW